MYKIAFILEQTLGHRTHTQNLQHNIATDGTVSPQWGLIAWEASGLAARLPIYRSNWTVRAGLRTRRAIAAMQKEHGLNALFIHTQVPAVLAADWVRRIPTVISLDATPLQYDALGEQYTHEKQAPWLERLKWQLNRYSLTQAQHLVTWSAWTKQSLVHEYAIEPAKITVIPPGVNVQEWQRPTARVMNQDPVKVLFVGGDLNRKGGDRLLAAFRELRQTMADGLALELHLVTRTSVAPEAGVTVYNDMEPNSERLKALFHHCDIFCLPTAGDCLPMVLAEAGATALPLVATDVGAIHEVVRDGETGFLIARDDQVALVQRLRQLIADPALRLRLGQQAARLVATEHDAGHNTEQLLTLLKTTAALTTHKRHRWSANLRLQSVPMSERGE